MRLISMFVVAMLLLPFALFGQGKDAKEFKYIGAKKCKACHTTAKSGAAYKKWLSSPHAKAFETLATPKAKEIAKAKGIEDPQKSEACLKCHDTAAGEPAAQLAKTFKPGEGVGCEVCHGPGSEYKPMKIQKAIAAGKIKPESVGMIRPDEKLCLTCHNEESPTFNEFNFEEYSKKIAHPRPEKKEK